MKSEVACISLTPERLLLDLAWWEIYKESFPSNEQEPPEVILQSLRKNVGLAFSLRLGDETLAIATTHLLKNPAAVFLVYLATVHDAWGRGYGGHLLEFAWRASFEKLSDDRLEATGLILEVDALDNSNAPEQREVRERRISFFGRHGLKLLPRHYLQPPVDGIAPVAMSLMFRPVEGRSEPDSNPVTALIRAIYLEKYHAINGIAQESLKMLLGN